jgi:acetylornithine deacetylase/succinyl-diaminopimelate desuccinylase-like protein
MQPAATTNTIENAFKTIIPTLENYIRIPNQSPAFDKNIHSNGYQEAAVNLIVDWVLKQGVVGLTHMIVKDEKRTPVILFSIPAHKTTMEYSVLMYGHLDKQPPLTEQWAPGLAPYAPVIRDGKLYGRGMGKISATNNELLKTTKKRRSRRWIQHVCSDHCSEGTSRAGQTSS